MLDNKENTTTRQTFSEKYLKDQKQISLRFQLLVMIIFFAFVIIILTFWAGAISQKFENFNELSLFAISGLFQIITGSVMFFFGKEVSKQNAKNIESIDK